ncbi:helix-turn-helix domain-containing protein [Dactylosporangium sp. NPDC000244]|uniref:helix-turn-helix domain-containing protein n=1 Tax=Dactylosporangium sp. NPDC000244 TaxID=3154365 RepID=UPI003323B460
MTPARTALVDLRERLESAARDLRRLAADLDALMRQQQLEATRAAGPPPLLCSIAGAAVMLSVSERTVHAIVKRGDLETVKLGGRRLVVVASIRALVERLRADRG